MRHSYTRLPIEKFGRHLLITGDLDPVYIALYLVSWSGDRKARWLVAYWCLYHCGAATYLSLFEGEAFWTHLYVAAINQNKAPNGARWPRGAERRHWRGKQAYASWSYLQSRYSDRPEGMVEYIAEGAPHFEEVSKRAQSHAGFGPWIGFKIADMVDRVLNVHVDFTEAAVFMFKDPTQAALRLWRLKEELPDDIEPTDKEHQGRIIHHVVGYLESVYAGMTAPPTHDRFIELQEVETILCKWKSHMNGHYPLFKDINEIGEGLDKWWGVDQVRSSIYEFKECMPEKTELRA